MLPFVGNQAVMNRTAQGNGSLSSVKVAQMPGKFLDVLFGGVFPVLGLMTPPPFLSIHPVVGIRGLGHWANRTIPRQEEKNTESAGPETHWESVNSSSQSHIFGDHRQVANALDLEVFPHF